MKIIDFGRIGVSREGYLSVIENNKDIPFEVKRVFWSYYTPDSITRGRHAHHETEMVLIAAAGRIIVTTEMPGEKPLLTVLETPSQGLYIPKLCWHTMQYTHNAVQLVLASTYYDEADYIREYDQFKLITG